MIQLKLDYLAAGGNRHPASADWSESGVLAFGSDRNIGLWQPEVRAMAAVLCFGYGSYLIFIC